MREEEIREEEERRSEERRGDKRRREDEEIRGEGRSKGGEMDGLKGQRTKKKEGKGTWSWSLSCLGTQC